MDDDIEIKMGPGPAVHAARAASLGLGALGVLVAVGAPVGDGIGLTPGALSGLFSLALWGLSALCATFALVRGHGRLDLALLLLVCGGPFLWALLSSI